MSTTLTSARQETLAHLETKVCAAWENVLQEAFGPDVYTVAAAAVPASPEHSVRFAYDFIPAQLGSVAFALPSPSAFSLGHRLLTLKRRASEHDHHALHATGHLLNRLAESLAGSLSSGLDARLQSEDTAGAATALASEHEFAIAFSSAEDRGHLLTVSASPAMLAALEGQSSAASNTALAPSSLAAPRNLELLLDLEMPVTISFGATRLPLNDVVQLAAGSIVELNRSVSEPVDIIVNNYSIARGEVVVVDGNFAVRIKQIMSKQERLRSLS